MSTAEIPKSLEATTFLPLFPKDELRLTEPSEKYEHPLNNRQLAIIVKGGSLSEGTEDELVDKYLTKREKDLLQEVENISWTTTSLSMANPYDRLRAARGLALAVPVFHGFGNFNAMTFHPRKEVMMSVNASKGRPLDQVASVTTTSERVFDVFAWDDLPKGLDPDIIKQMIAKFYRMGPFGFRGPATESIKNRHPHLTSESSGLQTVQLIAPGYKCLSNDLYREALRISHEDYLAITSANLSKTRKGGVTQPAHNRMAGIQEDFGKTSPQAIMLAHLNESWARTKYSLRHNFQPSSTSIIGFHKEYDGEPVVTLDRYGSLPVEKITHVVESFGLKLKMTEGAKERQPVADYS